jgi:tRNA pseudouridine13 synthase
MEIRGGAGAEGEQSLGVSMELPFLTVALRPTQGKIRVTPEDFRVDELPAYEPSGEGIRVLEAARHGNKLRTGHLKGNRFTLRVTGLDDLDEALRRTAPIADALTRDGVPNYYGEQRFGRDGDNFARGAAWLRGESPAPREHFQRKLLASSVQSELFNRCLAERVRTGKLGEYLDGDLLKKEDSGGLFTTEDAADAALRVRDWAVSPTGPMVGPKMRWPERAALAAELAALEAEGFSLASLAAFGRDGEGTRRVLRVRPTEIHVSSPESGTVDLSFTLPSGAYATVILRETLKRDGASHTPDEPIAENDDD